MRIALDKLTRHVLTRIWDSHAEFGYGGIALTSMARIDLDTAKKWRDEEKKRTAGKTDFTHLILNSYVPRSGRDDDVTQSIPEKISKR